ncbi:uncharacterized protein LOC107271421 [Cephus cinctus]|uniref:Uncharacterized protein LOC107271421 n=1 Tax=Cephus cinctus TaxID=211228 RepID=A0AAJ7W4Q3_CEPCN|nr:uncharacterized protein LOC107271421 [Cephus cinctus]
MMDTASEYPSTIDVCVVDSPDESCSERHYDEFTIVARRMSISRIFARNSMAWARDSLEKLPIRLTLSNIGILTVIIAILMPRVFTYVLVYPIFRLVFGTLYPAYASYKAVRTKNVKEYVKWMMYWIVFALFTCAETFTDVFFSFWFPFYYEIKIILVLWLLSPATKGSSILYRRFVHPALSRREAEIDEALARATEQGYTAVLHLGTRGVNYATTVLMQTAIKGGGGLVQQLKKSYSLSDLTGEKEDENRNTADLRDETDMEMEPRRREHVGRRGYSPRRTQSSSNRVEMYFSEVDVDVRQPRPREPIVSLTNIRSSDDISSGYSSGEALQSHRVISQGESLVRTASVGARTRIKPRTTTKKTPEDDEEDSDCIEISSLDDIPFLIPQNSITPEQALEILLRLSQNSTCGDYVNFQRRRNSDNKFGEEFPTDRGHDLNLLNTFGRDSRSKSRESSMEFQDTVSEPDALNAEQTLTYSKRSADVDINTIKIPDVLKTDVVDVSHVDSSSGNMSKYRNTVEAEAQEEISALTDDQVQVKHTSSEVKADLNSKDEISIKESVSKINVEQITDAICQDKFDELKKLISNAQRAVSNIVTSQERLNRIDPIESATGQQDISIQKESDDSCCNVGEDIAIKNSLNSQSNTNSLEVWSTPTISRSNSDSGGRAGKYNKKPAPRAPGSTTREDIDDTESQKALKATLIIKTGTVKTVSNISTSKDVFIAHSPKAKRKKTKHTRTKEGFSKLLTIPKNIFHSAFHKDGKDASPKDDDSSSFTSDRDTSRSRSVSVGSGGTGNDVENKPSTSKSGLDVENALVKAALVDEDSRAETYINLRSDSIDQYTSASEDSKSEDLDKTVFERTEYEKRISKAEAKREEEDKLSKAEDRQKITSFATLPRSKKPSKKKIP